MKEVVIVHPEFGIYLGNCMGLGFWSKFDAIGQSFAATIGSEERARAFVASWASNNDPDLYAYHPVAIAIEGAASVPELIEAGLRDAIGKEMLSNHLMDVPAIAAA